MPCYRIFCTPFYGPPAKAAVIQFDNAQSIAVDGSGNVYVTDAGNDRIQKFDPANNNVAVPTVTEWGMILFMILAGLVSLYYLKRIKRALEK
ncbi:MAG: hypothetical protein P8Z30_19640 [Acidobacteriota bacterium]